jgi:hypothetical protein
MGYDKKLINRTYHEIFRLSDTELTLPKKSSPTARAFKFITKFSHTFNWKKIQLILNNLHENIVQHYAIDGPDQNLITAEKLRDKQIKLVFSNDKNISSFFSKNVKH